MKLEKAEPENKEKLLEKQFCTAKKLYCLQKHITR